MKYMDYLNLIAFAGNSSGGGGSTDKSFIKNADCLFQENRRTDTETLDILIPLLQPTSAKNMLNGAITNGINNLDMMRRIDMSQCKSLEYLISNSANKNIKLTTWDTRNVTNIKNAFQYCKSTVTIDISDWDISKVNNASYTFSQCNKLTTLKMFCGTALPNIDTTGMFSSCGMLKTIIINTNNVLPISSNSYLSALPADCKIYVKDALVEDYMMANVWIDRADNIYPISEYVEEV